MAMRSVLVSSELLAGPSRICRSAVYIPRPPTKRSIHTSEPSRSGHNRWSKIRHRKGAADAQKSAIFSRLTTEIYNSLRPPASPDPIANSRLATALSRARVAGVPKDVVEKCIVKARSSAEGGQTVIYEAVGASGREAFIIECVTDNPARSVQRLKEILHKRDCRIAPVAYLFDKKGVITVSPSTEGNFDELFEIAVEGGAEDVREIEDEGEVLYEIITTPTGLSTLTTLLSHAAHSAKYIIQSSEISFIPNAPLAVVGEGDEGEGISEEKAEAVERVIGLLEQESDVVKIWTNLE